MRSGLLIGALVAVTLAACGKKETPGADAATVAPPETKPATTAPPETKPPETTAPPETKPPETTAPPETKPPETTAEADAGAAPADDAAAPTAAEEVAAAAEEVAAAAPHEYTIAVKAPDKTFHDMSDEEKGTYMKEVVVPAMRERFQHFDGEEFAKFNCATCHGPNPKERKFEMPNPEILKLPTTQEGFAKLMEKEGKAVEFMGEVVVPAMATLLGEERFNPETGKGFGCFECHMKEE